MQKVNLSAKENSRKEKSHKFDNKTAKVLLIVILFLAVFLFAQQVLAQTQDITGLSYVQSSGLGTQDIRVTIAKLIRIFFGLLGIIAVIIILYGGFLYMTSAGEVEKIKTAKKVLTGAVIGLIICLSAFGIAQFVITSILGGGGGEGGSAGPSAYGYGGGALGAGIIESHYPARGEANVSRKTKIIVTFKEPMCVRTLITGTKINTTNIKIYPTATGSATSVQDVDAYVTTDGKTFSFKPVNLLGSPDVMMNYTVDLGTGLQKSGCVTPAFGAFKSYSWNFTVSTIVDNTPPQILSVVPFPADEVSRNNIVQINFNEAIDPMTLRGVVQLEGGNSVGRLLQTAGQVDTYNYINVCAASNCMAPDKFIAGEFRYSNQYKTVEFITNDLCGKNSCGGDVYCLPGNSPISVLIKAAFTLDGQNSAVFPYYGLVDMSDNSLDGNKNGVSNGPGPIPYNLNLTNNFAAFDNVIWSFTTNNEVDLVPPQIISITPTANQLQVLPDSNFTILFDKIMMSSTLKPNGNYDDGKDYITLIQSDVPAGSESGYWIAKSDDLSGGTTKTKAEIQTTGLGEELNYSIKVSSNILDINQNCFMPCAGPGCNREAVPGGKPGEYQEGTPWTGTYPTCDLVPATP